MAEKKKDEKDSENFVLELNMKTVLFSNQKLGEEITVVKLVLTNPTKDRLAFKIKCTSNEMFKIKTPVGIVEPSASLEIALIHNAGKPIPENLKQYFAVYYIKASEKENNVRGMWKNLKTPSDGVKRLFIEFDKKGKPTDAKTKSVMEDGGEKKEKTETKEEKKGEEKKKDEKEEPPKKGDETTKKADGEKEEKKEEAKKEDAKKDEAKKDEKDEKK